MDERVGGPEDEGQEEVTEEETEEETEETEEETRPEEAEGTLHREDMVPDPEV